MRRLVIVLFSATLLMALSGAVAVFAQPSRIPHENPFSAPDSPDPIGFMVT